MAMLFSVLCIFSAVVLFPTGEVGPTSSRGLQGWENECLPGCHSDISFFGAQLLSDNLRKWLSSTMATQCDPIPREPQDKGSTMNYLTPKRVDINQSALGSQNISDQSAEGERERHCHLKSAEANDMMEPVF